MKVNKSDFLILNNMEILKNIAVLAQKDENAALILLEKYDKLLNDELSLDDLSLDELSLDDLSLDEL